MGWWNRPSAAARSAPWARRGKDRADPRHTATPQVGPPPGAYPSARDLRPSIRHVIDRVHRSSTKIDSRDGRGPNRGLCVQKKGAFNRGGQQAPIEFRGKTTKDVAVSIETLRAPRRLATTCDRRQLNAAKWFRKSIIVAFMSRPDRAVCFCCSLSGVVKVSHILASLVYLDAKR